MLSDDLAELFYRDLTRLLEELQAFPDTQSLWVTLPGVTNSAGTLTLHLEGNLREYVGRQLGHVAYVRDRPLEFSRRGVERADLVARVEQVRALVVPVLRGLTAETLAAPFPEEMFGRSMSASQMLIHLSGHLSYHLGQIDYLRRATTGAGAITLSSL